jgi:hypothetical protein
MNRGIVVAASTAVLAVAIVTTPVGAGTAKNPKALVLQKADFPAGARLLKKYSDKSPQVDGYVVQWRYKGGAKQFELIDTVTVMSPRVATTAFRQARGLLQQGYRKISLPRYGDEQIAGLAREDNEGELWVRKGGVVWALSVNTAGVGNWGLITRAESIAQLKQYAPKQAKRVGSG